MSCVRDDPQFPKLVGLVVSWIIWGLLLTVRVTMGPVLRLQLNVSVALPEPSVAAKDMVRGEVVQVTLGVLRLAEGRITVV